MKDLRFRQIHLDFHTSPYISGVGEKFDKKVWQERLLEAKVDSITCFSLCHHGMSYHPTKVGSNISETSNYSPVYEIIKDKILGEIKSAKPQIDKDRMNRLILFCDLTDDVLIEGAKSYFENNVSFNGKHQDKKLFQRVEIIKISPRNTHDYEAVLTAVTEQWNIQERPQNIIPYFNNCCPVKISGVG